MDLPRAPSAETRASLMWSVEWIFWLWRGGVTKDHRIFPNRMFALIRIFPNRMFADLPEPDVR